MKNLALLDVGGTTIKYGLWDGAAQQLTKQGAVATSKSLHAYYDALTQIVVAFKASDPSCWGCNEYTRGGEQGDRHY